MSSNAADLSRLIILERPSLLRIALRILGNTSAAEDVTQSLWLRVQRVEDEPAILNKRAYLYRLTSNLAIDHLQAEKRRSQIHTEAQSLLWGVESALPADRVLLANDMLERVASTLSALPDRTQWIFHRNRYDGVSFREIARELGISQTAVEKHMRRALTAIAAARDAAEG